MNCDKCGQPVPNSWGVKLDTQWNRLSVDGFVVEFTATEVDILTVLYDRFGKIVSYSELTAAVWPHEDVTQNAIRVHLYQIRQKFRASDVPVEVETIRDRGLRFIRMENADGG